MASDMVQCAKCDAYVCRLAGESSYSSKFDFCPMNIRRDILRQAKEEYRDPDVRRMAVVAARVEAQGYMRWTRVEEIMEFAKQMGFTKLGLTCCMGLRSEGAILAKILNSNGFEVSSVFCKTGSVPKEYVGLKNREKVRPGKFEPMCNPIAQAKLLNMEHTDLNIIIGLCVGHDSLFIKHSKAPVTCLIVKDRVLCHNPIGAIYTSHSYYKKRLIEGHSITKSNTH